jgi:hypothetical protein
MILIREWFRHALGSWKRPIGVPAGSPLELEWKSASRVPRTPRFVTALLLVAALAFLVTRDSRQAMNAGIQAWSSAGWWSEDAAILANLRKQSVRHRDPQLLALLALLSDDDNEKVRAANEAVQADASLTWIYSKIRLKEEPCCMLHPLIEPGVAALQKWDPDNAVPRLLAADVIYEHAEKAWVGSSRVPGSLDPDEVVEQDPKWLAVMDFAFKAPKYDGYAAKTFDLYRAVADRYGIREPALTFDVLVRTFDWGASQQVHTYDQWLLQQGEAAEQTGKLDVAVALYRRPSLFAEQVLSQDRAEQGRWGVMYFQLFQFQRQSFGKLQPLLLKMGRTDEAAVVQYQFQALQAAAEAESSRRRAEYNWYGEAWQGLIIRSLAASILVLGAAFLFCAGFLFLRRGADLKSRGGSFALACLGIDYLPLLLVGACAGLFGVYRPLAVTYQRYMSASYPIGDFGDLMAALRAPYEMPAGVWQFSQQWFNSYNGWIAAIAGLSILAVYILFRGTIHRSTI